MACPACFNDEFSESKLIPSISLRACLNCGLLISEIKRSKPTEAEFERINDEAYFEAIGTVRTRQAVEALSFIKKYDARGGNWLDIGCSFGYLLKEAVRAGYNVFGIEPDKKACEQARKVLGEEVVHFGSMLDDTRPDGSADVISMMDVLEHIPAKDLPDFACMIHRKLSPGGLWLLKVPSTDGLYFILAHQLVRFAAFFMAGMIKRLWQSEYQFPHTVYFNERTLRVYLENHGFEMIGHRYIADVPNDTIMNRLLMDNTIPRRQAYLIAPAFYLINFIEKMRAKSDAMLMLARRKSSPRC